MCLWCRPSVDFFWEGLGSKSPLPPPTAKSESSRIFDGSLPRKKHYFIILVFFFYLQKYCNGTCSFFSFHLLEHHAVWLELLLELSKYFDAHIRWRVRVMYFYYWVQPANLRNREVRTPVKRRITVRYLVPYGVKQHCRAGIEEAMLVYLYSLFSLLWRGHSVLPYSYHSVC
jgi:hypothetical protein